MTLAAAGTFWYRSTETICPAPVMYHIGTIAPEFNLSKEQVESYLRDAESVWEKSAGRELFSYTEKGAVEVNFIFDERQELADSQTNQKAALDSKREENDKLVEQIDDLRDEYEDSSEAYQKNMANYERKLNDYNGRVNSYNDQGGAPSDVYAELEKEKNALNRESNTLNATADTLNVMAAKINELNQKSGELITLYNEEVGLYNNEFGFAREFTQGDYQNNVINIYKFSSENEVRKVLAHEFGHSLGVDHVDGDSSVMYYLLEDTSSFPVLSAEDADAFAVECGTGTEFDTKLRAHIRSVVAMFTT